MGIGEAIATSLAEQGCNLILISRSEVRPLIPQDHPYLRISPGQTGNPSQETHQPTLIHQGHLASRRHWRPARRRRSRRLSNQRGRPHRHPHQQCWPRPRRPSRLPGPQYPGYNDNGQYEHQRAHVRHLRGAQPVHAAA
jgi:hypothetical protein